ncbi:MAG TPA: alpha/beta hydrolase [Ilumatobacter sp.]|nr:alpha/beta hydrolase [Ilumatobacter sp.]
MPLDPVVAELLAGMEAAGAPPLEEGTPEEGRAAILELAALGGTGPEVASEVRIDAGGVPAVVYTPAGDGPFPVLVFIHGGGWVIGNTDSHTPTCRELAVQAGCVVVSLDYRLAPEHKAPAAVDDSIAATKWVIEHAAELNGDPSRVAVGGDSAGGNLSALVAQALPGQLALQLLIYPAVDLTGSFPSIDENGEGYFLTKKSMEWFIGHYLDGADVKADDPSISPWFASDDVVAATAPALVITAEFDPLRDEGEAYAARLASLGVPTTLRRFDGMIHAFFGMTAMLPAAVEANQLSAEHLRNAFS